MNEILLSLSDKELSKFGRLREEITTLQKRHEEQDQQIAKLEVCSFDRFDSLSTQSTKN